MPTPLTFSSSSSLLLTLFLTTSFAQTTTWSSVIFALSGDRTPLLLSPNTPPSLTPLGATQSFAQGSLLRTRYLVPENAASNLTSIAPIPGLPLNNIDNSLLTILATDDEYVVAGAMAFLQGLYPPIGSEVGVVPGVEGLVANGSLVGGPLGGYQYPGLRTVSDGDVDFISIAGASGCDQYSVSAASYYHTAEFLTTMKTSAAFYTEIYPLIFSPLISSGETTYHNAFDLWDYAQYQYTHNATILDTFPPAALTQLRSYASQFVAATNANRTAFGLTPGDEIRTISGQTYAAEVVSLLTQNVDSQGEEAKLSLLFGDYEVFIAFASLATLGSSTGSSSDFTGLPQWGSVMAIELFSNSADLESEGVFPNSTSDLWVRFLLRNGTDADEALREYPLFGRGNSESDMLWSDFVDAMGGIMLPNALSWCANCGSTNILCTAFGASLETEAGSVESSSSSGRRNGLSPAVAGVIGAIVTLAVAALLAVLAALVGVRLHKIEKSSKVSGLGVFRRGSEKMKSDSDLTTSKGVEGDAVVRERVGSWELRDKVGGTVIGTAHGEPGPADDWDDREGDDLSISDGTKPVKVEDRV